MATDMTMFGEVRQFEDFLVTAIGDKPEIDIQTVTGGTGDVISGGADGRFRLDIAASNDDDIGAVGFNLNWTAGVTPVYMEARCYLSSIADNKFFVGFGDSLPSTDETSFSATTDTVTIDTMSDAFGILFDADATTDVLWAVAGATDAVTVNTALPARLNPVATEAFTLGCWVSSDRQAMRFYVNGEEAHRVDGTTVLVAAVDLCPMVQAFEQGTAFNLDVDLLYARKGRATT